MGLKAYGLLQLVLIGWVTVDGWGWGGLKAYGLLPALVLVGQVTVGGWGWGGANNI